MGLFDEVKADIGSGSGKPVVNGPHNGPGSPSICRAAPGGTTQRIPTASEEHDLVCR